MYMYMYVLNDWAWQRWDARDNCMYMYIHEYTMATNSMSEHRVSSRLQVAGGVGVGVLRVAAFPSQQLHLVTLLEGGGVGRFG